MPNVVVLNPQFYFSTHLINLSSFASLNKCHFWLSRHELTTLQITSWRHFSLKQWRWEIVMSASGFVQQRKIGGMLHAFFMLLFPIFLPTERCLKCPFCYGQSVVLAHKNWWRFHSSRTCCSDAIQLKSRNPFQVVFRWRENRNFPRTQCLEFELGPKIMFQINVFELAFFARIPIIRI